jgi:hypothetical protein
LLWISLLLLLLLLLLLACREFCRNEGAKRQLLRGIIKCRTSMANYDTARANKNTQLI